MSNGSRHALGFVAGLLLPPLVLAALWYGAGMFGPALRQSFVIDWLGAAALAAAAIGLALLAGSRLSPVASLLGGLWFTALGLAPVAAVTGAGIALPTDLLPGVVQQGFATVADSGLQALLGVMLLVVSVFPSRWRARGVTNPVVYDETPSYEPAPYDQTRSEEQRPSLFRPDDSTRPMHRP
ncbi:hypothetical protein [Nonomuraea maritima]|uniref:hypothetical protein n=1 Tax=Nonomuraea maritima TaxID=683260 RepID=UPI003723B993